MDLSKFWTNGRKEEEQRNLLTKVYQCYKSNKNDAGRDMKRGRTIEAKETEQRMLHIRLPASIHKSLRIRAAELDTTVQKLVVQIITHGLQSPDGEN